MTLPTDKKLLKIFSDNIRRERKRLGLTQEDMTDYGFGYRFYQSIEAGKSITFPTLFRLARAFNVPVSKLFKGM